MSSGEKKGKKRSKAFYRKSAYGNKRPRSGSNVLEPGIRGFLVMCNSNESNAVKESYNILNEYAELIYGSEQVTCKSPSVKDAPSEDDSDCEDVEKALKREVDSIKNTTSMQRRFQNVHTKAKNCIFIRTTVDDPVRVIIRIMEDIALRGLRKARYAARMLPIIGTCKAHTSDIEKLAKDVLPSIFTKDNENVPSSYTVLFKIRNNNASTCGKTSVIPVLTKVVSDINPSVKFSWSDYEVAVLVEIVCTVCCLGVAPGYIRLRKYNLQELQQGPKTVEIASDNTPASEIYAKVIPENRLIDANSTSDDKCDEFSVENSTLELQNSCNLMVAPIAKISSEERDTVTTATRNPDEKNMDCDNMSENSTLEAPHSCNVIVSSAASEERDTVTTATRNLEERNVDCDNLLTDNSINKDDGCSNVAELNDVTIAVPSEIQIDDANHSKNGQSCSESGGSSGPSTADL